ncbi:hypothetical protein [Pseudomonas viridiflava]|uniref:hypothetical protein n=1 Tax=Pseudomonas viridiflava TaxID=33069 RepID=UPI000F0353DD|nr:hypothetical protein [Pseudomonas viridiflava]
MTHTSTEILELTINHLTKIGSKQKSKAVRFPNVTKLKKEPEEHFLVIVEQAKKVLNNCKRQPLCGLEHWGEDREFLIRFLADDLMQFLTEKEIRVPGINSLVFAQSTIPEKAIFNIARSRMLPATYGSIELANHPVAYQTFSIPFLLRLAIENKIKSIIGFVSSDIVRPNSPVIFNTQDIPVAGLIRELKALKCLTIPCSLDDLEQIYKWSCQFCHTGRKEYLWLSLKAVDILAPLFSYDENLGCQVDIQTLWKGDSLTPEATLERLIMHKGPCRPLYYLCSGWSTKKLESALNSSAIKVLKSYRFHLSDSALDEGSAFYCSKNNTFI